MEHLRHFQLPEDPFRSDPLEKLDVALPSQRDALARLDRGVRQGKGILLLGGGVGAGKSRVARWLFEGLEEEVFEAGMLMVLRREVGADWLLPRLARQLGVEEPDAEREGLIAQIYERLAIVHEDGRRAVIIIDDAHALADPDTLSEVFALAKLEYEERRMLTIVLVGGDPLDRAVCSDPLLAHSVDVRVRLEALGREEVSLYLESRIRAAGGRAELLLPGAASALGELAGGAPGRLNVLADNALYEAWRAERVEVTRSDVERAHRGLGWDRVGAAGPPRPEPPLELGELAPRSGALSAQAEATDPMAGSVAGGTVVMDFDAAPEAHGEAGRPRGTGLVEATRIAMGDEPGLEAAPKDESEVDDLFMELLDD